MGRGERPGVADTGGPGATPAVTERPVTVAADPTPPGGPDRRSSDRDPWPAPPGTSHAPPVRPEAVPPLSPPVPTALPGPVLTAPAPVAVTPQPAAVQQNSLAPPARLEQSMLRIPDSTRPGQPMTSWFGILGLLLIPVAGAALGYRQARAAATIGS